MSTSDSMYKAPSSPLDRPVANSGRALSEATAGEFDFEIGEILSEAWSLTSGSKGVLWAGIAISFGIAGVSQVVTVLGARNESVVIAIAVFLISLGLGFVNYTIGAGMSLYGIKRAGGDASASFDDVISCLPQTLPIVGLIILYGILFVLGSVLFILPGIYLAVGYVMAISLKVERGLSIWESLETSRKAIHHCWFKMLGLLLILWVVIVFGSVVTLGIGIIWLFPFWTLVMGVAYNRIFGYSGGQ